MSATPASGTPTTRITVHVEPSYEVIVGYGLLAQLLEKLPEQALRVAIIHPATLGVTAEAIQSAIAETNRQVIVIEVPDAEDAKTAEVASFCWTALGQSGFTRTDAIVGLGGGSVTDLAGFVAGTWLRGVPIIQVPTTLLGMVDAAVGGKTGINTDAGKNLVGVIHSPHAVICDLATLETLSTPDYVTGLAEVIKCGFIQDPRILEIIEADPSAATSPAGPHTAELITRSIQVKANVVAADLYEDVGGFGSRRVSREILNYGHTLGHAIERTERYRWRHGAAISVGMVFAAELAHLSGKLDDASVQRHRDILQAVGLPTTYRPDRWNQLLEAMAKDKKTRGNLLRFIIVESVGNPTIINGPDPAILAAAYDNISRHNDAPTTQVML